MTAIAAGVGCSSSGWGPGAGSPQARTIALKEFLASTPATFCSRIEGSRASNTALDREMRRPGKRRWSSATRPVGEKPSRVSRDPSSSGAAARHHSAPGPHASTRIAPPAAM